MMRRHGGIGIVVLAALAGCSRPPAGPVLSHGHAAAEWVETLRGPDVKARRKAVTALAHLGAGEPAVVPALIAAVKDNDAAVRAEAILALVKIGPPAKDAVPVLTEALKDPDAKVRQYAEKALTRVQQ